MTIGEMLARWLPEHCPSCAGPTMEGFCTGCRGDFAPVDEPAALAAAGALPIVAPLRYAAPLDHYVHALKFARARRLGRALGLLLLEAVRERGRAVDALVPVPLHGTRLRQRGYNQAVEICRPLAHGLRAPMLLRGIARQRPTPPQIGLGAAERARNIAGAFAVARNLAGLRLAVVDDVVTTGATAAALAAALRAAGAAAVEAWAVALTPPGARREGAREGAGRGNRESAS
jgi:ComF family protein